ncbi:Putative heterokaryon incompatibility [Acrodontium crateriforme]|uniref:Heterokaryon incompatibility n=1 Tax=Acrodontium crateriforme TaxID=150365 RepID=A0AAQ3R7Y7_9PEZI|nr:Putative heterokaryon incompatibility [Acrodontium crateriforme]
MSKSLETPSHEDEHTIKLLDSATAVVTISRPYRETLFSETINSFSKSRGEADVIIDNLTKWSSELASQFGLRTGDRFLDAPFRLVYENRADSVPLQPLEPISSYLAVSYCWRHNDDPWPGDGSEPYGPWPFSLPFVEAVLAQRGLNVVDDGTRDVNFMKEGIWIDQMSINQANQEEKLQIIGGTDVIYKNCRRLLILLEDVELNEPECKAVESFRWEKRRGTQDLNEMKPDPEAVPLLIDVWRKVEQSKWWSRSWCWHEFETNEPWSARRTRSEQVCALFITKGPEGKAFTFPWLTLLFMRAMTDFEANAQFIESAKPITKEQLIRNTRWASGDPKISRENDPLERHIGVERSGIMAKLFLAEGHECTLVADIVNICINATGLGIYFKGRVRNRDELFWIVAAIALAAGEKVPLTLMKESMLRLGGHESWLSRHQAEYDSSIPRFKIGGNKGIHRLTHERITLDLVFFEQLASFAMEDDLTMSYEIFPVTPIPSSHFGAQIPSMMPRTPVEPSSSDFHRRQFLALACRGGLYFILRLWKQLERDVVEPLYNGPVTESFAANESLMPAAKNLFTKLAAFHPDVSFDSCVKELLLFLTWITDPRSMRFISTMILLIPSNNRDHLAILTYPIFRKDTHLDRSKWRLAIPTDLLDAPCSVHRVWILQPSGDTITSPNSTGLWESGEGKWKIVGKMQLFGDFSIVSQDDRLLTDTISLRTRQVVEA